MRRPSSFQLYLFSLGLLFVAYVLTEYYRPKPLNWRPTYFNTDKIPYGTFVIFDQLPQLLGTDSVESIRQPIYNQLTGTPLSTEADTDDEDQTATPPAPGASPTVTDSTAAAPDSLATAQAPPASSTDEPDTTRIRLRTARATYLFVNDYFSADPLDSRTLLQFVRQGNTVFIAAEHLGSALRDSLGVRIESIELPQHPGPRGLPVADSVDLRFTNPALTTRPIRLAGAAAGYRLALTPGRQGQALATDSSGRLVYADLPYGQGHFYVCAVPAAFSNYYFLRARTQAFAIAALRYLPAHRALWDEYQKQGPLGAEEQSLLRVLLAHPALRNAYYLALVTTLLYVVVAARRRQRIIPIIKPLPNTTLLFTRTVASLYRQGRNHALIAEKQNGLFRDYLRTRFQETTPDFADEAFRERLSQKAGLPRARIDELLRLLNFAHTAPQVNDAQLLRLSRALSAFRREAR